MFGMSGTRRIDVLANQPIRRWLSCHMFTRSCKRALKSRLSFSVEGRARLIPTLSWCLALYNCGTGKSNISSVFVIKVRPMEKTNNPVRFKVAPYGYSLFVLRAPVSTILGNLPITLSCTSLEPIEIKFWEIKLPF